MTKKIGPANTHFENVANLRAEKNTIKILPLSLTEKTYATRFRAFQRSII